jgi:outer membrane receptor for ferrienterochelin and colicin
MLFSSILHEIGEIWDAHWSWKLYVEDEWNIMDTMSYVLGVLWWSEN